MYTVHIMAICSENMLGNNTKNMVFLHNKNEFCHYYRERPLAFYVFTESKSSFDKVVNSTSSGALIQNNTLMYAGG